MERDRDKHLLFLKKLKEDGCLTIEPRPHLQSPYGYYYPEACELYETRAGEEVKSLEYLAECGFLERSASEWVHIWPSCHHFALNSREVCASCLSAAIELVTTTHHLACGHVAPDDTFQAGVDLV